MFDDAAFTLTVLGILTVDANGRFRKTVSIPSQAAPGKGELNAFEFHYDPRYHRCLPGGPGDSHRFIVTV